MSLLLTFFRKHWIAALVLSCFFLRVLTLLTAVEYVHHDEELFRGAVTEELIKGLRVSFSDYRQDPYCGGTLVMAVLSYPFFAILGPHLFSLKLAALVLFLLTLAGSVLFVKRYFGEKEAVVTGLLLIFCPPVFTGLTLIATGGHGQSLIFSILMLYCFYEYIFPLKVRKKLTSSYLILAILGVISAIGFWFIPITAITFLAILLTWFFLQPKKLLGKGGLCLLVGVLVGLTPWFLYNFQNDFEGLSVLKILLRSPGQFEGFSIYNFVTNLLLGLYAGVYPKFVAIFFSAFYSLLTIFFLFLILNKNQNPKFLFFLIYIPLHLFAYFISSSAVGFETYFHTGYRYLVTLYFFIMILVAIAVARHKKFVLFLGFFLLLGGVGQAALLFREPVGQALKFKGYSYGQLGEVWGEKGKLDLEGISKDLLEEMKMYPERKHLYWELMTSDQLIQRAEPEQIKEIPKQLQPYILEAWGAYWVESEAQEKIQRAFQLFTEEQLRYFYRGLTSYKAKREQAWFWFEKGSMAYQPFRIQKIDDLFRGKDLGDQERLWFWQGVGRALALRCLNGVHSSEEKCLSLLLENYPEAEKSIYRGIGWGVCELYFEDEVWGEYHLSRLSEEIHKEASTSFQACHSWYQLS